MLIVGFIYLRGYGIQSKLVFVFAQLGEALCAFNVSWPAEHCATNGKGCKILLRQPLC